MRVHLDAESTAVDTSWLRQAVSDFILFSRCLATVVAMPGLESKMSHRRHLDGSPGDRVHGHNRHASPSNAKRQREPRFPNYEEIARSERRAREVAEELHREVQEQYSNPHYMDSLYLPTAVHEQSFIAMTSPAMACNPYRPEQSYVPCNTAQEHVHRETYADENRRPNQGQDVAQTYDPSVHKLSRMLRRYYQEPTLFNLSRAVSKKPPLPPNEVKTLLYIHNSDKKSKFTRWELLCMDAYRRVHGSVKRHRASHQ